MDTGKFESFWKRSKSEGKKCLQVGKWFVRVYGELDNKPMVELESFQIVVKQNQKLEEENQKLKKEKQELEYLGDINEELKWENKKLKDEVDFWETEANKHQKELIEQHDRIINQMKKIEKLKEELRHWEEGDYCYDYFDED